MATIEERLKFYEQEEKDCTLDHFSRADALALGLKIHENAQKYPDPAAIEITVNGLCVFRYFPEGTGADNALWLRRKRNAVELMQMSSKHFGAWLESNGETLEDRKLKPKEYAIYGGGFPIILRGTGVIGSICVSGMPDTQDHQVIVDGLKAFIAP